MKYFVIVNAYLPQGKTAMGFEVDAPDPGAVLEKFRPARIIHEALVGCELETEEISTKKRRGVTYYGS